MNKNIINFLYGYSVTNVINFKEDNKEQRFKDYEMIKRVIKSLLDRINKHQPITDFTIRLLISYTADINKYKINSELFHNYYGVSVKSLITNDIYIFTFDVMEVTETKDAFYVMLDDILYI